MPGFQVPGNSTQNRFTNGNWVCNRT